MNILIKTQRPPFSALLFRHNSQKYHRYTRKYRYEGVGQDEYWEDIFGNVTHYYRRLIEYRMKPL